LYYLSHDNILNLDHSTEAVIAIYERSGKEHKPERAHLLVINYLEQLRARKALNGFVESYLADGEREKQPEQDNGDMKFHQIEDGWMGYRLHNRYLALVFGCPDQDSVRKIISGVRLKKYSEEE
jgi:hypothetical protein